MKSGFWKTDWFFGLVVAILVFFVSVGSSILDGLERSAYDAAVRMSGQPPSPKIRIIAIDDESINRIGRWPWPRDIHAKMVDDLKAAQAKVIGHTAFFFEPQQDPGLKYINKLMETFQAMDPAAAPDTGGTAPVAPAAPANPQLAQFATVLREAEAALNTDRQLGESFKKAGNVVLPMVFQFGEPLGKPDKPLPEYLNAFNISSINGNVDQTDPEYLPPPTQSVQIPIDELGSRVALIGHLNGDPDIDGAIRTEPLIIRYYDQLFPSLSLMLAAQSLNLSAKDIKVTLGEEVQLGNLKIRTDPNLRMNTYFYATKGSDPSAFPIDSFYDVKNGKVSMDRYKDAIVLIGASAAGLGSTQVTPVSPAMSPVESLAHAVSSILQENFYVVPIWADLAKIATYLLIAAYLMALLPRLKAGHAAGVTAALLVVMLITHFALMTGPAMWVQLVTPMVLLVVGHLLLTIKRFVVTERGKLKSDAESAESNRMLGLAFQGQGNLDMAFDKFRRVPLDAQVMENLYNLALDFERKRQFNKAESVFRYMHDFDPKFRDLAQRLSRAKQLSETVILGTGGGGRTNASILDATSGSIEKPMLGRYQVEKELGKGAMGVVYLGRDPKINRVVAIKTMALSQEFDADELQDVKDRFFREAETAGRLNHPNIVTIFDAGEEHDLAYIAMEFLKGKDLIPYTKSDNLLPVAKAASIVARVADALSYAHTQNVVHRDIKPANIMWEPEGDTVKVTDFGIARITDSSKTKTGMVLGTPSYMSPEQLSGKKIDGRSDLFSLGVTLFQMLTGKLPFAGDSMAQLMFKIANEAHEDPRTANPSISEQLADVINRALTKDADSRYQTGDEFARAIRGAVEDGGVAPKGVDFEL